MLNKILRWLGYEKVVRCKDCRFHENEEVGMVWCPFFVGSWVKDDFFCGTGKEKEDAS